MVSPNQPIVQIIVIGAVTITILLSLVMLGASIKELLIMVRTFINSHKR